MNDTQPIRCDIAIAFALAEEAGGLVDRLADVHSVKASGFIVRTGSLDGADVCVVETGIGAAAARRAVPAVLRAHKPQWMISAGFAGGLQDGIRRGDTILPDCIATAGKPDMRLEHQDRFVDLTAKSKIHRGRLVSVDKIVRLPDAKRELGRQFDAVAVDMETYCVAEACRKVAEPLLAVRVISDEVGDEISADIAHIGSQSTAVGRVGAALGSLFRRPSSAKDMMRLREQALVGSDLLADILVGTIQSLCPSAKKESRISTDSSRIDDI